jgi:hypothetical protein
MPELVANELKAHIPARDFEVPNFCRLASEYP